MGQMMNGIYTRTTPTATPLHSWWTVAPLQGRVTDSLKLCSAGLMAGRCLGATSTSTFLHLLRTLCQEVSTMSCATEGGLRYTLATMLSGVLDILLCNQVEAYPQLSPAHGPTTAQRVGALLALTADTLGAFGAQSLLPAIAEPLFAEALAARRETLGDSHAATLSSCNNCARPAPSNAATGANERATGAIDDRTPRPARSNAATTASQRYHGRADEGGGRWLRHHDNAFTTIWHRSPLS